jgi:hypothetical protein
MIAISACAANSIERSTTTSEYATSRRAIAHDDASVAHLHHEPWGEFTIGGMPDPDAGIANGPTELVAVHARDGGVTAGAGPVSAELAWLVSHIADTPDRLRSDDSDNARQLAARGADGIRAVAAVFARGDALRLPFARRVVERNVTRACGPREHQAAQELVTWIELGGVTPGAPDGVIRWNRTGDAPWSAAALARLDEWVARGMPCTPPDQPPSSDAPRANVARAASTSATVPSTPASSSPPASPSSSPRGAASGREPAAPRRP